MSTSTPFNEEALRVELHRLEEVGLAFDTAQDELYRLLEDRETPQWELDEAAREANRRFEEIAYQQSIVRWCQQWVRQQRVEMVAFKPRAERLRHKYGQPAGTESWLLCGQWRKYER